MQIAIIGHGNMGKALEARLKEAGHTVEVVRRGAPLDAVSRAQMVFLALPADAAWTLPQEPFAGRVVVDLTNPLTPDYLGLTVGYADSSAERLQRQLPGARVVKAWNTVFSAVLQRGPDYGSQRAQVFVAADDAEAKRWVTELVRTTGFEPVDAGALKNARYLEPLAELMIQLGYVIGRGTQISPAFLSR